MNSLIEYNWHETAIFTKHKHVILTWENSLKYSAWQLSFAFSCKWCCIEKIWKTWWYPTMDDSAQPCQNKRYIGCNTTTRRTGVFDQGVFAKACKKRWCYVETFNNIRNIIFSNYLVIKTDPLELNKRHRHWNWSTTISLILCYTAWIITVRNDGSVLPNEISTLRIQPGHFENSTFMRYTSNCLFM
jgi:hypothetical protein